jgi:uncharacterized protein HemX
MNANLYCLYSKRLREEDEEPQQKKGLLQRGKEAAGNFVKKHAGKLAAGVAGAAIVGSALAGGKNGKVTPEELQQQNMTLQQQLDNNLKMDVMNLMHKAQTGNTQYSQRIYAATQPLADNVNSVDPKKQPGIKKEGGGIVDTIKGVVGL